MTKQEEISDYRLRNLIIKTFEEYGGWWKIEGMAGWLDVPIIRVKLIWDRLTKQGLMERKRGN